MTTATPVDQDQAQPCRPTITCTAEFAPPGSLEVEAGAAFAHGAHLEEWTVPFLLKQTFASWFQLQVGSNGYTLVRSDSQARYLDNIYIGPKFHLVDQKEVIPSIAWSAQVSLPTFPAAGYVRETDLIFVGYASKDLKPIHVDWNVGLDLWRLGDSTRAQGYTSLVLSTALPAHFGVEGEGYIFSGAGSAANHDGGLRGVVTFSPRPWLVFDAGADAGFFRSVRGYTLFAGMTIIPVVFWREDHHSST